MMCFHFKEKYTRHNRRIVTVYLLTQGVKGIDVHDFWCYDLKDRKPFWVFVVVGGGDYSFRIGIHFIHKNNLKKCQPKLKSTFMISKRKASSRFYD